MRRSFVVATLFAACLVLPATAPAHLLDHPAPSTLSQPVGPLSTQVNSGGEGAKWELLTSLPTANPHSDLDYFTKGGEIYASVGVLGIGANGGGQSIVKLTEGGGISPSPAIVSSHPSAACPTNAAGTGLQHDVEATPKSSVILNTVVPKAERSDAQLLLDASDAAGRCHDAGILGIQNAPKGGLEIIDIADIANPKEIGFTSHIGESHTVNVDPRRPHIAYSVTSDSVGVNAFGVRGNEEGAGRALDGFEVVDLRSCLTAPLGTIPAGATIDSKRELCRPQVYRFRYPSVDISLGHTNQTGIYGCHELEVYPDDRLTCASGAATILFDVERAFDDNGTPDNFLDDTPRGTPLPCRVRASSNSGPSAAFTSGAKVTDCVVGGTDAAQVDLGIPNWQKLGSPSLTGVRHVGTAFHQGRESTQGALQPKYDSTQDIDFSHEAELTDSRRFIIASDERGGGVAGGAQCAPGEDLKFANGGLHAYAVDRLQGATPGGPLPANRAKEAHKAYALTPKGEKAIFRVTVRTEPKASFCTAHVFHQIPGQNRIFMGWYSQGTQVVDFTEKPDGTVEFSNAAYFIPENANEWVSAIFKMERNADGTFTYYGATGDGVVGDAGRNGIDIYKVTLPAPPAPAARVRKSEPRPTTPPTGGPAGTAGPGCPGSALLAAEAAGRGAGRGLSLRFRTAGNVPVTIDIFQQSVGRRIVGERRVRRFTGRRGSLFWNGRDARRRQVPPGYYFARLRARGADGRVDTVRLTLGLSRRRFGPRLGFHRREDCGTLQMFKLSRPVFGGLDTRSLGIAYRLARGARVSITVTDRRERVVRRFKATDPPVGKVQRLRLSARGLARGDYRVKLSVTRDNRTTTETLTARRL